MSSAATVACSGSVTTSVAIELEVWVKHVLSGTEEERPRFKVTEAMFTYVAIDAKGKKRAIKKGPIRAGRRQRPLTTEHETPFAAAATNVPPA